MLTTLSLGLLLATADQPTLQPEAGYENTKTLTVKTSRVTEEGTMFFSGQEMDAGTGSEMTGTFTAKVTDTYRGTKDGRSLGVTRTFEEIDSDTSFDAGHSSEGIIVEDGSGDEASGLLERVVDWMWDEDEEEYVSSFADDDEGPQEWLDGLHQDLDLSFLLPDKEVEEGQRWDLGTEVLGRLLSPGGQMMVTEPASLEDVPDGGIVISMPDAGSVEGYEELDGKVIVTYAGSREVDGVNLASFDIEVEAEGVQDIGETLQDQAEESGMPATEYDIAELERSYEGEGKLVWNLDTGTVHSFDLELETASALELEWLAEAQGMELELGMSQLNSGTIEISLEVE